MKLRRVIRYIFIALLVIILGAFTGWYLFLRSQKASVASLDAARGFNTPAASASFGATPAAGGFVSAVASSTQGGGRPQPLWRIASTPAAGIGFATTTSGLQVRYVERATGYIFAADPQKGTSERLINTLSPKIYEAFFGAGGRIVERSIDGSGTVTTSAGVLTVGTTTSLMGVPLQKGIVAVATDGKTPSLVYALAQGSGVAVMTALWDGTKPKQLFTSPLPSWRLQALPDGRIVLAQKASDGVVGYAYTLKNGVLTQLTTPTSGLTVLPRSNSGALIFGTSAGSAPALFVQLSASSSPARLPISTIADKCVWVPGSALVAYCAVPSQVPQNGFLDVWYRGEAHSSDVWWKVDASAGKAQVIFTPPSNMPIDVKNPVMDDGGTYIAFINNIDLSPWLLRLDQ